MNFRHLVRPVARAVGAAIGFRARLRPARRGSDPERDEKFESGSWRAQADARTGLAGRDGPPKRIFSAPRLPSKTSKRERRHITRRSPKSSNKELGKKVLPHCALRQEFAQEPVRYAAPPGSRSRLVSGQIGRLTAVDDGFGDVRGEIAEADDPCEIGRAHPLPLGECGKRHAVAKAAECAHQVKRLALAGLPRILAEPDADLFAVELGNIHQQLFDGPGGSRDLDEGRGALVPGRNGAAAAGAGAPTQATTIPGWRLTAPRRAFMAPIPYSVASTATIASSSRCRSPPAHSSTYRCRRRRR